MFSTLARRARETLLLSGALKESSARPTERQELIRTYYAAALDRSAVADQLTDERGAVAALLLYGEALPMLVAAIALAHDPDFVSPASGQPLPPQTSPWDVLADLRQRGRVAALPARLDRAREALEASDALAFDRLPPQTLLDRRTAVQAFMRRLRQLVEPRTSAELKGSRVGRLAGIVAVPCLLVLAILLLPRSANLALKRPVSASSRHPNSTAPADNSGLTNGKIEATYGIETAPGASWVMVDLGQSTPLSKIKIFNRRDASPDSGLPLVLDISEDTVHFIVVDTRTEPFSATKPWIYEVPLEARCRYVRIRSNSMVALTEVEVY